MELVRAQRNAAEARYVWELEAIRERFGDPDFDPDCPVVPIRSSDIRALVRELSAKEETALVEFFLTDRNLVVFIVSPPGLYPCCGSRACAGQGSGDPAEC